jgi:hypothetical protein
MKRSLLLTFAIAAAVVMIFGSKPAQSQEKKEIKRTIIINDRDTIINGKKLSEASPTERKALLKELSETNINIKRMPRVRQGGKEEKEIVIKRRSRDPKDLKRQSDDSREFNFRFEDGDKNTRVFRLRPDSLLMAFGDDSLMNEININIDGLDSNLRKGMITMNRSFRRAPGMPDRPQARVFMGEPGMFENEFSGRRNNSQTFNYTSTDKDGISSRMSIRISEAGKDVLKKLKGNETTELPVNDLTLSPNFSSGKLNLSFSLGEKGQLEVVLLDNNLKEIFKDKQTLTNQTYFKQVNLQKNGVYYIRISQGSKTYLRKVIKE